MSTDLFVRKITHLKNKPREKEALAYLQRVASLVKPIMRKHNWTLPVLAEFFPTDPGLLGVNINRGAKICIRLRPHFDDGAFFEEHDVIGTMLHELTHNVHEPHDQAFYKYLSQLEDEFHALQISGYAGEGFHSTGKRLGEGVAHNLPPYLAREKALNAAEKRRQVGKTLAGGGQLGGRRIVGKTPRELAAEAAERRARDEKSCAFGAQGIMEAEQAAQDGVEDDVIPNALADSDFWQPGIPFSNSTSSGTASTSKTPSSQGVPTPLEVIDLDRTESESFWLCSSCTLINDDLSLSLCSLCSAPKPGSENPKPSKRRRIVTKSSRNALMSGSLKTTETKQSSAGWICSSCTLENTPFSLSCELCESRRPIHTQSDGWTCLSCGESGQDHGFWSCATCGWVKKES